MLIPGQAKPMIRNGHCRLPQVRCTSTVAAPPAWSAPQNSPLGEGFYQSLRDGENAQIPAIDPARIGGVIAWAQRPADDGRRIVLDVDDVARQAGPLHLADQASRLHGEPGFLFHLPHQRLGVRLTWLNAPAG